MLRFIFGCLAVVVFAAMSFAQPAAESVEATKDTKDTAVRPEEKRMFGLVPNYISVPAGAKFEPLTAKQKFNLARRGSFDPMMLVVTGINAGLAQWTNQYPELGQGAEGFAKRYGLAAADTVVSNFVTGAIFPSVLHQDPRYFRLGNDHSVKERLAYSTTRIFRIRGDDGRWHNNYSEILGNMTAVSIGALYYPEESRHLGPMASRFGFQVGTDCMFNVLKEFWPDIHDKILVRHKKTNTALLK